MLDRLDWPGRLTLTGDRDAALDGADFVLVQLRVGGQAARLVDETLPLRFGVIGQETTGAGGFAKALRTVPGRPRARRAGRAAGGARTPGSSTSRTRSGSSPRRCSTTATGRSGCATSRSTLQRRIAARFGVDAGAGRARARRAQPPDLGAGGPGRRRRPAAGAARRRTPTELADEFRLPVDMLRAIGAIPSYYLRYYYLTRTVLARAARTATPGRATSWTSRRACSRCTATRRSTEKPALLDRPRRRLLQRGRGAAHRLAPRRRRATSRSSTSATTGRIPDLPDRAVVEIPAAIDRDGAHPLPLAPLAPEQRGLVQAVKAYEELDDRGGADRRPDASRCGRSAPTRWSGREVAAAAARRAARGRPRAPAAVRPASEPARRASRHAAAGARPRSAAHQQPSPRSACLRRCIDAESTPRPETRVSASYRSQAYPTRRPAADRADPPPAGSPSSSSRSSPASAILGAVAAVSRLRLADDGPRQPARADRPTRCPRRRSLLDRTGQTELARFGEFKREVVTFEEIPPIVARRDHRDRGQDVLGERRLRPAGDRRRRPRLAARQQPRRVDDHPAARPRPAARRRSSSRTRTARSSASSRRSSSRSG